VHDSAVAIVDARGEVVFAEGTERHHQVKRAWNCPPDQVGRIGRLVAEHCEPDAELVLARSWSFGTPAALRVNQGVERLYSWMVRPSDPAARLGRSLAAGLADWLSQGMLTSLNQEGRNLSWHLWQETNVARRDAPAVVSRRAYDHHLSHAAAACFSSPFEEATCAVLDGYGEGGSAAFFRYEGGKLERLPTRWSMWPGSLGIFYAIVCLACGFDPFLGEEWKVMGLAPYGTFDEDLHDLLRPLVRVEGLNLVPPGDEYRRIGELLALRRLDGSTPMEAADLAFAGQRVFAEVCREVLGNLYAIAPSPNLVLAGGCALNSSWNGRIVEETPFEHLHVFAAPADDGNAVGAAWLAFREDHPATGPRGRWQSPYLGSRMSSTTLEDVQRLGRVPARRLEPEQTPEVMADLLAAGKIVGWVQGRAEFGPRALGNRSILADPRRPDVKQQLNDSVKFREPFRPFAPSILHEHGSEWFEAYQPSPYMERTLRFREEKVTQVPGVAHVDGTGRLQSVQREWNPRFYDLIAAFRNRTGVPLVLNTSFNVMGRPIIHSVEDALAVFFSTGLDAMAIGDVLFAKGE